MQVLSTRMVQIPNELLKSVENSSENVGKRIVTFCEVDDLELDSLECCDDNLPVISSPPPVALVNLPKLIPRSNKLIIFS